MIQISDILLRFLVPQIKGRSHEEIRDLLVKTNLEIEEEKIDQTHQKIVFFLKPLASFCDYSRLWVLAQEVAMSVETSQEFPDQPLEPNPFDSDGVSKSFLFDILNGQDIFVSSNNTENKMSLLYLLFGKDIKDNLTKYLIWDFCQKNASCKASIYQILREFEISNHTVIRGQTAVKLETLLPIFEELRSEWKKKVVEKLERNCFLFERQDDLWIVQWPPWYSVSNLPPFSEILARLVPLNQNPQPIALEMKRDTKMNVQRILSPHVLSSISQIRKYLKKKGFVECTSCKIVPKNKNLNEQKYYLSYNQELTLRDNLHYSLAENVLLKNLNQCNKIFPVFELSFSPWISKWLLGLSSSASFSEKKQKDQIHGYNLDEIMKILRELFAQIFKKELHFDIPQNPKHFLNFSAALIKELSLEGKGKIGQLLVHRFEQFEIRKQEIISVSCYLE